MSGWTVGQIGVSPRRNLEVEGSNNPIRLPSGLVKNDLVVIGMSRPTASPASVTPNGYAYHESTVLHTHTISHGNTCPSPYVCSVFLYLVTDPANVPVPYVTSDSTGRDVTWITYVVPSVPELPVGAAFTDVTDAGSGTTAPVSPGRCTVRYWSVMGDNQHITVPDECTVVDQGGHNPLSDASQFRDVASTMTVDADDGGARTAITTGPTVNSGGWMMFALSVPAW